MKLRNWLVGGVLGWSAMAMAQTQWPEVQARNYPLAKGLELVRHEQSILLGEGEQQTGLFFAKLGQAYSDQVQQLLVTDAQDKGWKLQTALRHGTYYVLTFSKGLRLLDIRLLNTPEGVDAVYSVTLNQQQPDTTTPTAGAAAKR